MNNKLIRPFSHAIEIPDTYLLVSDIGWKKRANLGKTSEELRLGNEALKADQIT